jgi:hypothetical protein
MGRGLWSDAACQQTTIEVASVVDVVDVVGGCIALSTTETCVYELFCIAKPLKYSECEF